MVTISKSPAPTREAMPTVAQAAAGQSFWIFVDTDGVTLVHRSGVAYEATVELNRFDGDTYPLMAVEVTR